MNWRYLSEPDVAHVNERVTGSPALLVEPLLLRSAVGRQWAGSGDHELYPTLVGKAGALLHGVATNHAFIDGNKRTATVAAIALCRLNGGDVKATQDEIVSLAVDTVDQPLTVEQVIERLRGLVIEP